MGILPIIAIGAIIVSKLKKSPETSEFSSTIVNNNDKAIAKAQALKQKIEEARSKAGKTRY